MTSPICAAPAFEPLSQTRAALGESPVWSVAQGAWWWVDTEGRHLLCTAPDGATQTWPTPETPGFVQVSGARVLVGMETGIFDFDPGTARFRLRAPLETPGMRYNDACTDAAGRIWAGTMDLENLRENGALYLFDPATDRLLPRLDGFRTINGLAHDAGRGRIFFSDSHPSVQTVWTCDLDPAGNLGPRRVFARFDALAGRPDGAAFDSAHHYWIAGVGGATLYRFDPEGGIAARHRVPVAAPTKPAFGPGGVLALTSRAAAPGAPEDAPDGRLLVACGPWYDTDTEKGQA